MSPTAISPTAASVPFTPAVGEVVPGTGGHGALKKAMRSAIPPIASAPNSSRTPGASTYLPVSPSVAARTAIQ